MHKSWSDAWFCTTVKPEWSDRIQLSPDDYLQGVIGASNELVGRSCSGLSCCMLSAGVNFVPGSTGYERRHAAELRSAPSNSFFRERSVCWVLSGESRF